MENLQDILGTTQNPLDAAGAVGIGGLQKLAGSIVAAVIRVLDFILPVYGAGSREGDSVLKAIKSLQTVAGDAKATDVLAAIQTLISSLPANMQEVEGGNMLGTPQSAVPQSGVMPIPNMSSILGGQQ